MCVMFAAWKSVAFAAAIVVQCCVYACVTRTLKYLFDPDTLIDLNIILELCLRVL